MVSQVVDEILAAEEQAQATLDAAYAEAAKMKEDAVAQGEQLAEEQCREARERAQAILQGAALKAEAIYNSRQGQARAKAEELRRDALTKQPDAVQKVIEALIPGNHS